MEERLFHLKSRAIHAGEDNELVALDLEIEIEGEWQAVATTATMAPFRAFVCSALMCQHAYLRLNAAERGLSLGEARGELWMKTSDWLVGDLKAEFKVGVRSGRASETDRAFIAERMRDCPVSRNLREARKQTLLNFV